jgi:Flp pilus assembly CpaE family ATPase
LLPNDYATTVTSVNEGRPVSQVAANGDLDRAFQQLAEKVFRWAGLEMNTSVSKAAGVWPRFMKLIARKR